MGLFGFGKKKQEEKSCCGEEKASIKCCSSDSENSRFIVLGDCCKKALDTFENTKKAVAELGLNDKVVNTGDMAVIAKYGVIQTPALVIDNKVVSYGKLLKVEEIRGFIEKVL